MDDLAEQLWQSAPLPLDRSALCCCGQPAGWSLGTRVWCDACLQKGRRRLEEGLSGLSGVVSSPRLWAGGLVGAIGAAWLWQWTAVHARIESPVVGFFMGWMVAMSIIYASGRRRGRLLQQMSGGYSVLAVLGGLVWQNLALWSRLLQTGGGQWVPWEDRLGLSLAGLPTSIALHGLVFWSTLAVCWLVAFRLPVLPPAQGGEDSARNLACP